MKIARMCLVCFILICMIIPLAAIDKKSYSSLTDRDRIMLALSYYEVSMQYKKVGKTKLAESYMLEAKKIEPEVTKYASGEKALPPKSISIDWDSIFQEAAETDESETSSSDADSTSKIKTEDSSVTVESDGDIVNGLIDRFISALLDNNAKKAASCFTGEILVASSSLKLTRDELEATIAKWLASDSFSNLEYQIDTDRTGNTMFDVAVTFKSLDTFFIPMEDNTLYLVAEKSGATYLFSTITANVMETSKADSNVSSGSATQLVYDITENVIKGNLDRAVAYFSRDIWFNEFEILVSSDSLKTYFTEWKTANSDIAETDSAIVEGSVTILQEKDTELFSNWQIELDDFYQVSVQFITQPLFPGSETKSRYILVVEEFSNPKTYQVVAVAQL
jgi:hypothetical protein